MSVLRVYDPPECDEQGVLLDWECCRACEGTGRYRDPRYWGTMPGSTACDHCEGHGSLKTAALAYKMRGEEWALRTGGGDAEDAIGRCEDCSHPTSDGTWEGLRHFMSIPANAEEWAVEHLRRGDEPPPTIMGLHVRTHYSACDEGCRHGGPGRYRGTGGEWVGTGDLRRWGEKDRAQTELNGEASWRQVDIRTLGWPHDLRPEKLAVLCLRCYAAR